MTSIEDIEERLDQATAEEEAKQIIEIIEVLRGDIDEQINDLIEIDRELIEARGRAEEILRELHQRSGPR